VLRPTTMYRCIQCGGYTNKIHRKLYQRLPYASIRECGDCSFEIRRMRRPLAFLNFVFSLASVCPRCGSGYVLPPTGQDNPGPVSQHLVSVIYRVFGAHALRCALCRIQYHDWRGWRQLRKLAGRETETHSAAAESSEQVAAPYAPSRLGGRAANHGK
jgi:hypothetical protein